MDEVCCGSGRASHIIEASVIMSNPQLVTSDCAFSLDVAHPINGYQARDAREEGSSWSWVSIPAART